MELENVSPGEAVLIFAIVSALVALLGRNREIGYGRSLVCCFFGTPILGLIIVLCSEKNSTREERLREERVAERARDFVMKDKARRRQEEEIRRRQEEEKRRVAEYVSKLYKAREEERTRRAAEFISAFLKK